MPHLSLIVTGAMSGQHRALRFILLANLHAVMLGGALDPLLDLCDIVLIVLRGIVLVIALSYTKQQIAVV